jgi:hypothetical protein
MWALTSPRDRRLSIARVFQLEFDMQEKSGGRR